MRKFFTSVLAILVLAAAIFTCCGQTRAFASLFASPKAHDCCKKDLPPSSEHQSCDCHHEISAMPVQADMVKLVQNLLRDVVSFDGIVLDFPVAVYQQAAVFYNGPPDQRTTYCPLYDQYSVLRL